MPYRYTLVSTPAEDMPQMRIHNAADARSFITQAGVFSPESAWRESCHIILLDNNNHILGTFRLSEGSAKNTVFDVSLACKIAVDALSSGVILAHNHPSGDAEPSNCDIRETERLRDGLRTLGIDLLDHIVVGHGQWYSFSDETLHRED